jgi:hypothetical protein
MSIRLLSPLLVAILAAAPVAAQEGASSSSAPPPSSSQDSGATSPSKQAGNSDTLPVSLDRIKQALEDTPTVPLAGLNETPQFKVEVQEHQRFEELVKTLNFNSGPPPPGGLYAYEQQQNVWSKQQHPEMQPYGAFGQGQAFTILLENLLEKYFGGRVINAVANARDSAAEAAAREEVRRALTEYWASQAEQQHQAQDKP